MLTDIHIWSYWIDACPLQGSLEQCNMGSLMASQFSANGCDAGGQIGLLASCGRHSQSLSTYKSIQQDGSQGFQ